MAITRAAKAKSRARTLELKHEIGDLRTALEDQFAALGKLVLTHRPGDVYVDEQISELSRIQDELATRQAALSSLRETGAGMSVIGQLNAEVARLRACQKALLVSIGGKASWVRPDMPGAAGPYAAMDLLRSSLKLKGEELKAIEDDIGPVLPDASGEWVAMEGRWWKAAVAGAAVVIGVIGAVATRGCTDPGRPQIPSSSWRPPPVSVVALADAARAKSEAEAVWGPLRGLDRGDGFGELLDQAENAKRTADNLLQVEAYPRAKAAYEDLKARCKALAFRQQARQAKRDRFIRCRDQGQAASAAKDFARAIAAFESALREQEDADVRGLLDQARKTKDEVEARQHTLAEAIGYARSFLNSVPSNTARLTNPQRRQASALLEALDAVMAPDPADQAARALEGRLRACVGPPTDLTLDCGGGVTMDLVLIPAGEFLMGPARLEERAPLFPNEPRKGPQQRVMISNPFYMGKHEVTQAQWQAVMGDNPSYFQGDPRLPVELVRWRTCQEFCRKLSVKTGRTIRLPTEAEWEYACRAGTTTPFHYGSSLSSDQANFNGNYPHGGAPREVNRQRTTPVGSFQANEFGLYDMHGNVWEWCQDEHGLYAPLDARDPIGPQATRYPQYCAYRGGSWTSHAYSCRSANSSGDPSSYQKNDLGLRVVSPCSQPSAGSAEVQAPSTNSRSERIRFKAGLQQMASVATRATPDDLSGATVRANRTFHASEVAGTQASTSKEVRLDCGGGTYMDLVLVPAGEFMMGSPVSEVERDAAESPQHQVRITTPFYMGRYEVTQGQWLAVMGDSPSTFTGDSELPVEHVSWDDCQEFCKRLSSKTGRTIRLPTEAEWEYACRAGTATVFHYGDSLSSDQANFRGDSPYGGAPKDVYRVRTMPVGSFQANAFGLHDMHGNVFEWCQDWWGAYSSGEESDPVGSPSGDGRRVLRGGSWKYAANCLRSACRWWGSQGGRFHDAGFRVVVSGVEASASNDAAGAGMQLEPGCQRDARIVLLPTSERQPQIWSYTTIQPAGDWFSPQFDDRSWKLAVGGFGTRDTPGAKARMLWMTRDIWLRRDFDLSDGTLTHPLLSLHHDDDAEVYINGVLAIKATGYTTRYEDADIDPEAARSLRPGRNVIAVHCRQISGRQYIDVGILDLK